MGDASGQPPEGLHLLGLAERGVAHALQPHRLHSLGDVAGDREQVPGAAGGGVETARALDPAPGSVRGVYPAQRNLDPVAHAAPGPVFRLVRVEELAEGPAHQLLRRIAHHVAVVRARVDDRAALVDLRDQVGSLTGEAVEAGLAGPALAVLLLQGPELLHLGSERLAQAGAPADQDGAGDPDHHGEGREVAQHVVRSARIRLRPVGQDGEGRDRPDAEQRPRHRGVSAEQDPGKDHHDHEGRDPGAVQTAPEPGPDRHPRPGHHHEQVIGQREASAADQQQRHREREGRGECGCDPCRHEGRGLGLPSREAHGQQQPACEQAADHQRQGHEAARRRGVVLERIVQAGQVDLLAQPSFDRQGERLHGRVPSLPGVDASDGRSTGRPAPPGPQSARGPPPCGSRASSSGSPGAPTPCARRCRASRRSPGSSCPPR